MIEIDATMLLMVTTLIVVLITYRVRFAPSGNTKMVVVLGDFGRSPRMQYHTKSLVSNGFEVDVVALKGSNPISSLRNNNKVRMHLLRAIPKMKAGMPRVCFLLYAPIKVLIQVLQLMFTMIILTPRPSTIICQNPPSIPTLPIVWFVSRLRASRFIIDWHNYGYSILALTLSKSHWLVRFARNIEKTFGRLGDRHLCVTNAMRQDLNKNWNIVPLSSIITFHDRPDHMYRPTPPKKRHDLFLRLSEHSDTKQGFEFFSSSMMKQKETIFTYANGKSKPNRPALLVSSTSWTKDEDFGILLDALRKYDERASCNTNNDDLPPILCIITGKGPQRAYYENQMKKNPMRNAIVCTVWLSFEDYPLLLGSADLGISLHMSSSALDLPMKVVDMFGAGLPVCAANFTCISELVKDKINGYTFNNSNELASQLIRLLSRCGEGSTELSRFRENLKSFREDGWAPRWNRIVKPLF